MAKDAVSMVDKSNQFQYIFSESIIPQGLIEKVISKNGEFEYIITVSNKAFKKIASFNADTDMISVESGFHFLEGFNKQTLDQFYRKEQPSIFEFVYSSGDKTFKLSLNKNKDDAIIFVVQDISAFQSVRSELNEKKRQLKESQEIAHLGYWVENHGSDKHFWSEQVYKILNENPKEIVPSFNNYLNFVHKKDIKKVSKAFDEALQNKTGYEITHKLRQKNGSIKFVNQRCYTNYDYSGNPVQSIGIIQDITASEIIKEELKNSEAIFRSVFDFSPIAIVLVNENYMPVFCNNQFSQIVSLPIEDIYRKGLKDFTYPDDYESNLQKYNRLFNNEVDSFSVTKRYLRPDGSLLWAKVIVSGIKNAKGKTDMAIAMVQDISAEKKATQALIKSEYQYRTLIENANDGIGLFDYNFKPIIYNQVLHEMLGYSVEEYLKFDHNKYELFHPDDTKSAEVAINKIKAGEPARIENRMKKKDGTYSFFSISYIPVQHEDKPAILIFRRDISKRKIAEQQNEEYRLFLETIMDNLPVSLFAKTTPDFRYLYWNNTIEKSTGISAEEAIGKSDFELMQFNRLADQYRKEDEKLLRNKKRLESEHAFTNALGECKKFKTIKTLHQPHVGNPLILGISMDITQLKEAEQQIEQSTQMLKEAQKIAKLGYWEYDVKRDLFFDNLENRQILGTENLPYFINAQQFKELLFSGDQKLVEKSFQKCILKKVPGEGIIRVKSQNGVKHVSIQYRPVLDEDGVVEKLRGTCLDITRIRNSEMALRESEKRLKQAEHIAKVGYWDYDYIKKETQFSDEIWNILEVSSQVTSLGLKNFFDAVHNDDKINVTAQFQKSKNSNLPFDIEFKIVTKNDNIKHIKAIGTFVKNQEGNLVRSIGTFQDVTDLKKNELVLENLANQLIEVQHAAKIGFIEQELNSKQVKFSDNLLKVLELDKQFDISDIEIYNNLIHPDDKKTIIKTIEKSISKNQSYNIQYRLKLSAGKIKFVNEICSVKANSLPAVVTRIIQDITPRKEQKIIIDKISGGQESELLGSWEYNLSTGFLILNDTFKKHFQAIPQNNQITKEKFLQFVHLNDRFSVEKLLDESIKIQESFSLTFRLILKDFEVKYVQNYCNFYTNSAGERIMYSLVRDINDYRETLNELQDKTELFKSITENSLLGIVIYQDGKRVYANKKWANLVGFEVDKFTSDLKNHDIYKLETAELIGGLFEKWNEFQLTEFSNKINVQPLNAPQFMAEIYAKEIQYRGKNAIMIISFKIEND